MIFRIKRHWWSALLATGLLISVAWPLGGADRLVGRLGGIPTNLAAGVCAGLGLMALNYAVHQWLRLQFGEAYERRFYAYAMDVIGAMGPVEAVGGGLMAGLGEEPVFRGVVVAAFESPTLGVICAAMLFGIAHYLRREFFWFFVWGISEGLLFGLLYVMTDSVIVPAVAHGLFDTVGFLYFEAMRDTGNLGGRVP
jgi:membrane protease YdiL (CAAX protease family)